MKRTTRNQFVLINTTDLRDDEGLEFVYADDGRLVEVCRVPSGEPVPFRVEEAPAGNPTGNGAAGP